MINEVKVYSRFHIDEIAKRHSKCREKFPYRDRPWYLISIHTDEGYPFLTDDNKKSLSELGCRDAISLQFWDITDTQATKIMEGKSAHSKKLAKDLKLFSSEQAKEVIGFIMSCNQDDEDDAVMTVHCDAGISRSGAIGTFVVDFLRLDYQEFINGNTFLRPNSYMLSVLRRMSGMTPKFVGGCEHRDSETEKGKIYHGKNEDGTIFLPNGDIF